MFRLKYFENDNIEKAAIWLIGALIFVWPIPHTNAVRYILIAVLAVVVGVLYTKKYEFKTFFTQPSIVFFSSILLLTTIWFYIVALFLSDYTQHSLKELNSQWLLSVGCFFIGLFAARVANNKTKIILAVLFAVMAHVAYVIFEALWIFVQSGELQDKLKGLTGGRDRANVLTNIAIAVLLGEIFFRVIYHKHILPLRNGVVAGMTAAAFFSLFLEGARLGIVGVFFMFFTLVALALYTLRSAKNRVAIFGMVFAALIVSASLLFANLKYDKRWANLFETIELAVDIQNHKAWIDIKHHSLPTLKDGTVVNESNYRRPAWIVAGISFIAESPLGNGYARDAFGLYRYKKYGEGRLTRSAHSSLIDFGVGGGIPALVGWLSFLIGLSFVGLRGIVRRESYYSLLLFFLAGGFFFRMCIDGIARDHMLEQFMFLAGLMLLFSLSDNDKELKSAFV